MNNLTRFWFSARHHAPGVTGFRDIRCYLVMALYLGSFVCFASDPFFRQDGLFVYRQGLAAVLLAFLVTSAWNWELNWFGRSRGANLLLQMLQMLPATLFFARVAGRASAPPKAIPANFFEGVLAKFRGLLEQLLQLIPDWLSSPFANWRLTLLVMAVLAILACRRQMLKSGALLLLLGGLAAATAINVINSLLISLALSAFIDSDSSGLSHFPLYFLTRSSRKSAGMYTPPTTLRAMKPRNRPESVMYQSLNATRSGVSSRNR